MTLAVNIAQSGSNNQTFRNRIINGAMVIDQRNAGASQTPGVTNTYNLDRWYSGFSSPFNSRFTFQQNAGGVTPPSGFTNYLGTTVASAYTPSATEFSFLQQVIEGFNVADLGWGAAGAQPVTLSFWVRSSLTGAFPVVFGNDYARGIGATYTINAANTWEYKTITIPGDTTGTWNKTNGIGLRILFSLGSGSSTNQPTGSWGAWVGPGVAGTTLLSTTNGATFYLTGVQLEEGTAASPFEFRPIGTELALCQRYFWRIAGDNTDYPAVAVGTVRAANSVRMYIKHPVSMRTYPTFSFSGAPYISSGSGGSAMSGISGAYEGLDTSMLDITTISSVLSLGDAAVLYADGSPSSFVQASAEL